MNDMDRQNLIFIMESSPEDLEDFYDWASEEDLIYALKLVQMAQSELVEQELELLDEQADQDLTQAQQLLKQFQL